MQKYLDTKNSEYSTLTCYHDYISWPNTTVCQERTEAQDYLFQGFTNKNYKPAQQQVIKYKEEPFRQCSAMFRFRQRYSSFTDEKCSGFEILSVSLLHTTLRKDTVLFQMLEHFQYLANFNMYPELAKHESQLSNSSKI